MVVRRVAAILALDVVGYSRRMADNELSTLEQLHDLRAETLYPAFERWNGRVFKEMGDGFLAEFSSVVNAVECAAEIQAAARAVSDDMPDAPLQMRIGIHFGEVVAEGEDLFGDTVNIAARIESAADHGGVWLSEQARGLLGNRVQMSFRSVGARKLKNIPEPVQLFALVPGEALPVTVKNTTRFSTRNLLAAGALVAAIAAGLAFYLTGTGNRTTVDTAAALPGGLAHASAFRDCPGCPEMIALAGGRLMMGAPEDGIRTGAFAADQGPRHAVNIAPFAIARLEVTRGDFNGFLKDTGHQPPTGCRTWEDGTSGMREERSFAAPGYDQEDDHPAVCISWHDAQAYLDWLSRKSGQPYRLPSEAEWEFAARGGTDSRFHYGGDESGVCRYDNIGDATAKTRWPGWETADCSDGRIFTAPVGSYSPNPFGLMDLYGNVREWVRDCWHNSYEGAPDTSEPWLGGPCTDRVVRGGSWDSRPSILGSTWRGKLPPEHRDFLYGFRVARDLD